MLFNKKKNVISGFNATCIKWTCNLSFEKWWDVDLALFNDKLNTMNDANFITYN